jgi:glycosyltransferase involved in cell wall biosynthesis
MSERIRVLQVISNFNIESGGGGEERFVSEIVKMLDQNKFKITVCGLWELQTTQEQERMRRLDEFGISTFTAARWNNQHPFRSMLQAMRGLRFTLRSHPVDIVHAHSVFGEIAVLPLSSFSHNPKLLRTLHISPMAGWNKRSVRRFILSQFLMPIFVNKEIGVSQAIVDYLDQRLLARIFRKKAILVSNTVNLERFSGISIDIAKKRSSLGIPADALVVGSIGRLAETKGWHHFLQAATIVLKQIPQVFFLIIGDGRLADQLKQQAYQEGISSHIIFTGGRPDVEELLFCMDLFVSSSLLEGLPTVILESMAAGIPVVATDIPGTRDLIRDRQNGWLVPSADGPALAQAIQVALEDSEARKKFSLSLQREVNFFSMKKAAVAYENIYTDLMRSNSL